MSKLVAGTITALTPIHHGSDESAGIDRLYRRLEIYNKVDNKIYRVPIISGNSIRGQLRDLLAYDLITRLEIEKLDIDTYDLLFSGGTLRKGATTAKIDINKITWIREKYPFLRLFGGSIGNHIMQGEFQCGIALLVCKETEHITGIKQELSMNKFLSEDFGTRMDNSKNDNKIIKNNERKDPLQMRYVTEVIVPGARFSHEFTLHSNNDIVNSCFWQGFELLQAIGNLAGKGNIGYGKVELDYKEKGSGKLYRDFIEQNKQELASGITKIIS